MTAQTLENPKQRSTSAKKGGPYTEQEKLNRQNKVYHLHFEKGYSAVRIAEELRVNRNTINSDIKTWYLQLAEELPESEAAALFFSQIRALRYQKARLVDRLEKQNEPKIQMQCEKLISDIDYRIGQMVVKLMTNKQTPLASIRIKKTLRDEKEGNLRMSHLIRY